METLIDIKDAKLINDIQSGFGSEKYLSKRKLPVLHL